MSLYIPQDTRSLRKFTAGAMILMLSSQVFGDVTLSADSPVSVAQSANVEFVVSYSGSGVTGAKIIDADTWVKVGIKKNTSANPITVSVDLSSYSPGTYSFKAKTLGNKMTSEDSITVEITGSGGTVGTVDSGNFSYFVPTIGLLRVAPYNRSCNNALSNEISSSDQGRISELFDGLHVNGYSDFIAMSSVWSSLKSQAGSDFMVLPYFQSTVSAGGYGIPTKKIEENFKDNCFFYLEGTLANNIGPTTKTFTINKSGDLHLKASTKSGIPSLSASEYITVIRIGDEIMRIASINNMTITVDRNFQGSGAQSHYAGDNVYSPVYYNTSYPGNATPSIHWNFTNPLLINTLYWQTKALAVDSNASGLWFDLTSGGVFKSVAPDGSAVAIYDIDLGRTLDQSERAEISYIKTDDVRRKIEKLAGFTPDVVCNNNNAHYFDDQSGVRKWLDGTYGRPVDGAIMEEPFGCYQKGNMDEVDDAEWRLRVGTIAHASTKNLAMWPWLKSCKYEDLPMEDSAAADQAQLHCYASFLMGYETTASKVKMVLSIYKLPAGGGSRSLNTPDYLGYDLGSSIPLGASKLVDSSLGMAQVVENEYKQYNRTYRREYQKGYVYANPSLSGETISVLGGSSLYDPETGQWITQCYMPAKSGKILLKQNL